MVRGGGFMVGGGFEFQPTTTEFLDHKKYIHTYIILNNIYYIYYKIICGVGYGGWCWVF